MPDTSQALREASDGLLRDLEALGELEEQKRTLPAGHPQTVDLSTKIEEIAERVLARTTKQRILTTELQERAETGGKGAPDRSIDETPRSITAILNEWRQAERRLAVALDGSAEHEEATILVERLRREYARAHDEARRGRNG
jgi:hypothetical protein